MITLSQEISNHYASVWSGEARQRRWENGPVSDLPASFCVLEFPPTEIRSNWIYATCCMSQPEDPSPIELHLVSPVQNEDHVELLTVIAYYHRTGKTLALGHTVNFGRPWLKGSSCDYGLITLPYLDGPIIEYFHTDKSKHDIRFLWLIPITRAERDFKKSFGLEALEQIFEEKNFDYLNPIRQGVV